ncbi:beta-propeller fold lactonase family protein [Methanocella sp. MCL-LM]|uniref:YVTN family beta-propeller repeat protein n=1 Tax=Methanocella sp. MCL-LM TaxID=3412035 RepID=UPI003C72FE4D
MPFTLVVSAAGPYAYITNFGDGTVSVIDTQTNTVATTVAVGSSPIGVAVNPAGTTVYVTNRGGNSLSVIDAATNTVTATVTVGTGPSGVAVNPAGTTVYVTNFGDDTVSVIDAATNTVTGTISVGSKPYGVAVNPAGTRIYVTNMVAGTVSVIDAATNAVTDTVTVGEGPYGVAVNSAGTTVYTANYDDNSVSVIDAATNAVTDTVTVGDNPFAVAVNPAGNTIYAVNSEGSSMAVIDAATNAVTATVTVGDGPYGVALTPDGSTIYVVNQYDSTVSVVDAATNTVTTTVSVGSSPAAFGQFIVPAAPPTPTPTPTPVPVASIDSPAGPQSGTAPLTVDFQGSGTNSPTSWLWTFGADGTSTEQNPSHTFSAAEEYNVTLVASNAGGASEPDSVLITVTEPTPTPTPTATPTVSPTPTPVPVLPGLAWEKTFGRAEGSNIGYSVLKVSDGYVVTGSTTPEEESYTDVYLLKTDFSGNRVWNRTFGGDNSDEGRSVIAVSDGYVIAGTSWDDVGFSDMYVIKTDLNGNLVWEKRFGGADDDWGRSVVAVSGGYAVAGTTWSSGSGSSDVYLVKTDLNGNLVWEKTYGGEYGEFGNALGAVSDGYVIAGRTNTYGAGSDDVYLVKTNLNGDMAWNTTYGGEGDETGNSLLVGNDGYFVAGTMDWYGGTGNLDVLLLKTDFSGNRVWNQSYGGPERESGNSLAAIGGGYVIVGDTNSYGNGSYDVYLVKTNSTGGFVLNATYGGPGRDIGYSVAPVGDGYVIAGQTGSIDVKGFAGGDDFRVMRPANSQVYLLKVNPRFPQTEAPTGPYGPPLSIPNPYQRVPSGEFIVPPGSNLSDVVNASQPATPTPTPLPVTPTPAPAPTATPTAEPSIFITPPPPGVATPVPVPATGIEGLLGIGMGALLFRLLRRKR